MKLESKRLPNGNYTLKYNYFEIGEIIKLEKRNDFGLILNDVYWDSDENLSQFGAYLKHFKRLKDSLKYVKQLIEDDVIKIMSVNETIISRLQKALKEDPELYYSYQSNIAMPFVDCCYNYKKKNNKKSLSQKDIHIIANEAAKQFLDLLIK